MGWKYRIVKISFNDGDLFAVREVFYNKNNIPYMFTDLEISPAGSTFEEFLSSWKLYKEAFKQPVLYWNGKKFFEIIDGKLRSIKKERGN